MKHSKHSNRWLREHVTDPYVKQAQQEGYRSRAAYKLLEIQEKDRLFKRGMTIVDLGAAPGSWSQIAATLIGEKGRVYALDLLPMDELPGVTFIQGDFRELEVMEQLIKRLNNTSVDLVISDMAPNISGMNAIDQPRAMYLAECALEFSKRVLKPNGMFLVKVFQGEGFDDYLRQLRRSFSRVVIRKPRASRGRSREMYLVASGYRTDE